MAFIMLLGQCMTMIYWLWNWTCFGPYSDSATSTASYVGASRAVQRTLYTAPLLQTNRNLACSKPFINTLGITLLRAVIVESPIANYTTPADVREDGILSIIYVSKAGAPNIEVVK